MSPVDKTKRCNAGLKLSSATPLANDILRIEASVALICSFVAPVAFCNANANCVCAFSSSIAALTPSTANLPA